MGSSVWSGGQPFVSGDGCTLAIWRTCSDLCEAECPIRYQSSWVSSRTEGWRPLLTSCLLTARGAAVTWFWKPFAQKFPHVKAFIWPGKPLLSDFATMTHTTQLIRTRQYSPSSTITKIQSRCIVLLLSSEPEFTLYFYLLSLHFTFFFCFYNIILYYKFYLSSVH